MNHHIDFLSCANGLICLILGIITGSILSYVITVLALILQAWKLIDYWRERKANKKSKNVPNE